MLDKESLLADGWRELAGNATTATYSFTRLFRLYPVCRTNGKLWVNLRYWDYRSKGVDGDSFELEIRAETFHGDWVIFKSYSFDKQDEIPDKCDRLLKAWTAAND